MHLLGIAGRYVLIRTTPFLPPPTSLNSKSVHGMLIKHEDPQRYLDSCTYWCSDLCRNTCSYSWMLITLILIYFFKRENYFTQVHQHFQTLCYSFALLNIPMMLLHSAWRYPLSELYLLNRMPEITLQDISSRSLNYTTLPLTCDPKSALQQAFIKLFISCVTWNSCRIHQVHTGC